MEREGRKIAFIEPDWLDVPAGPFQMGTTTEQARLLHLQRAAVVPSEQPAHLVELDSFKMARYPVTVMEYRCFMDADGYQNDGYWKEKNSLRWRNAPLPFEESYQYQYIRLLRENKEALLKQLDIWVKQGSYSPAQAEYFRETMNSEDDKLREQWAENESAKRDDAGKVVRPWLWDYQQYTVENQPVIGVSWYEACAYAVWLTETLKAQNKISGEEIIRLPTEAEWEKAARGGSSFIYSWGDEFACHKGNFDDEDQIDEYVVPGGLNCDGYPDTAPVGSYPAGASAYGVLDMNGNVWEWVNSQSGPYPYRADDGRESPNSSAMRVTKGGAFTANDYFSRSSNRRFLSSVNSDDVTGFRCVTDSTP